MRQRLVVVAVAAVLVGLFALHVWWVWAQYGSCMEKFNDWFYCIKHAL